MNIIVIGSFLTVLIFFSMQAHARFGVQLPFVDGKAYECKQNSNDGPSHNIKQTRYDLDFGMSRGTLIVAASGGKVIAVKNNCKEGKSSCGHGFGNYIKIKNYNEDHSLLYAHLQYHGVIVNVGDDVNAGQPIGFSGNTGHSTGPHLHFGLHDTDKTKPGKSKSDIEIWSHDRQTGQDIWRRVNVPRNDDTAFVCEQSKANGDPINARGHFYKAMDINGFIVSAFQCSSIGSNAIYCWRGEKDSTGRYHAAQCENANYHIKYYKNSTGYHSQALSTSDGQTLCSQNQGQVGLLAFLSGSYGIGGGGNNGGSSSQTPTTGADANVKSARASLQSDSQYKKTLHVQPQQEVKFKVTVNNKGDENFTQAFIHYYLDTGTKTLQGDGSEWIGEDDIGTLKPRQKVTDKLQHIHAPTQDGAYYLYACIWSESDQQDDTQWDNNCSNRRREYVKLIVQSVPMTDLPGTDTDGYATSSCGQAGYTIKECMVLLNIIFIKPNP